MDNINRKPQKGRPPKHPKVQIIQTGEVFDTYEAVAKTIGGHRGNVLQCLRGLRETCCGYSFRYVAE